MRHWEKEAAIVLAEDARQQWQKLRQLQTEMLELAIDLYNGAYDNVDRDGIAEVIRHKVKESM